MIIKETIIDNLRNKTDHELFTEADSVRAQTCGDDVHIRAIIEFSNYCRCLCKYCGLNAANKNLKRYRMTLEEVTETAKKAFDEEVGTIVLQSGEDPGTSVDDICRMIDSIKKLGDIAITLSSGNYSKDDYKRMFDAGADRYLLKIETTNERIFHELRPGTSYAERVQCLHDLKDIGYQVGSGSLIGLPGQSIEDIAEDIMFCVNLDLDMATFSPFIPHPETPLKDEPGGKWQMGLRVLAAARIVLPYVHIPCSTALASITPDDYISPLKVGANIIMADITPDEYVRFYDIYPGKAPIGSRKERDAIDRIKEIIKKVGRPLGKGRGDTLLRHR